MADKAKTTAVDGFVPLGTGVLAAQQGDYLLLAIDISDKARKAATPSSTGKTFSLGTTHGFNWQVPGAPGVGVSLNVAVRSK